MKIEEVIKLLKNEIVIENESWQLSVESTSYRKGIQQALSLLEMIDVNDEISDLKKQVEQLNTALSRALSEVARLEVENCDLEKKVDKEPCICLDDQLIEQVGARIKGHYVGTFYEHEKLHNELVGRIYTDIKGFLRCLKDYSPLDNPVFKLTTEPSWQDELKHICRSGLVKLKGNKDGERYIKIIDTDFVHENSCLKVGSNPNYWNTFEQVVDQYEYTPRPEWMER